VIFKKLRKKLRKKNCTRKIAQVRAARIKTLKAANGVERAARWTDRLNRSKRTGPMFYEHIFKQAAAYLGVGVKTLRRWDREGRLKLERTTTGRRL
jgi:excisionase family DNA binding protein